MAESDAADDPVAGCGTTSAYQRHRRRGEDCDECRAAQAADQRKRRTDPVVLRRHRDRDKARLRALSRLGRLHPDEYERLYVEEMGPPTRVPPAVTA